MPNLDQHPAGNFVWMELATTDQPAAKAFYTALFGWEARDIPMGPGFMYTMFLLQGRDAGAAYTIKPEDRALGVPPHWLLYVAVENADDAVSRALELGGQPLSPAFDIPNVGRMAVIRDPAGATFAVFQPGNHRGLGVVSENGAFCWADLQTPDRELAVQFYGGLFGWEFVPGKDKAPGGYLHIKNGDQYIGGLPSSHSLPPGVPPHWLGYFQCESCESQTARAVALGAAMKVPPMIIEGQLHLSVLADPQGAVFALFASERKE
jgi:hypothetical protein